MLSDLHTPVLGTNETDISNEIDSEGLFVVSQPMAVLMCILYISVSVLAVGGNVMVCHIVLAHPRMRTVTNFFILNLAVGDILMACLCIPFGFVSNLLLQYWPFGAVMCVVVSYAQAVSVFISAYTLIAISIDRYIAIMFPLRPRMTRLQSKLIIFMIWIVALITPLPTAVLSRLEIHPSYVDSNDTVRYVCMEMWESQEQRYQYSMALMVLQYFFPLTVLLFTYSRVGVVVWGNKPPGEAEDVRDQRLAASKRKMVRMMITVVSAFTLCWLPLNALNCTYRNMVRMMITVVTAFTLCWLPLNALIVAGYQDTRIWQYEHIVYIWFASHWLAMSHAAYNPIIYCWMSDRFREGFLRIYHHVCCREGSSSSPSLHRCNNYTTYTSNLSIHSKYKPSPTHSTKLTVQHVCKYGGCSTDEEWVNDSQV